MASKQPAKTPSKPARPASVNSTPPAPPTSSKGKSSNGTNNPTKPTLKIPLSASKKPAISSPRGANPLPPLVSPVANGVPQPPTPQKKPTATSGLKRPTTTPKATSPIISSSSAAPNGKQPIESVEEAAVGENDSKQDITLVQIFHFLERQILGISDSLDDPQTDKIINDKFQQAFTEVNYPFPWTTALDSFKNKIAEPREMYMKQIQKIQEQVNSQVFVMNERLVNEQEVKEQLTKEVVSLRKQMGMVEDELQSTSMLRRSLHINLQAAMDHLLVSTKLLSDYECGGYRVEDSSDRDDNSVTGNTGHKREPHHHRLLHQHLPTTENAEDLKTNSEHADVEHTDPGGSVQEGEAPEEEGGGEVDEDWADIEREGRRIEREGQYAEEEEDVVPYQGEAGEEQKDPIPPTNSEVTERIDEDAGFEFFV